MTPEQRERFMEDSKGKTIESVEYDDVGRYWVLIFTDESEMCVRLMAEEV